MGLDHEANARTRYKRRRQRKNKKSNFTQRRRENAFKVFFQIK